MIYIFAITAFLATTIGLLALRVVALKYGYTDNPGGRKKHSEAVPPIGGLLIIPIFVGVSWLAGLQEFVPWPLACGLMALMAMGAVDDVKPIPPFLKFTIMVWTACFVVIFGETQIGQLGNLFGFGLVEVGFISKAFTVMCLVLLMNAINMMDGVDGLAGGFCCLAALWMMAACAGAQDHGIMFQSLLILFASIVGFLVLNLRFPWIKSAKVFLGDSGSLGLGLVLGWFLIKSTQGAGATLDPVTAIWIIAFPVMDAFALFLARSLRGFHPFHPDRRHFHYRLLDMGVSPSFTTAIILFIISSMATMGFLAQMYNVPDYVLFYAWLVLFAGHTACIIHPKGYTYLGRNLKKHIKSKV